MAGLSSPNTAKFAGFALAGSGIFILLGLLLVSMLLLSLIPIYQSNSSESGYGDIYVIPGFTIKAIYTNVTVNFTGGNVVGIAGLSNLCTFILRQQQIPGFYACVASNFTAYGPTGNLDRNSVLQRRELDDVALYEVGDIRLVFSNTCANRRGLGIWSSLLSPRQNSSCLAQRLSVCRSFITTPNSGPFGNQWLPIPTGYAQLVISNTTGGGVGCAGISITSIFNVAYFNYASIYGRFNISRPSIHAAECALESIAPQWFLQNLASVQTSWNTTVCTATVG